MSIRPKTIALAAGAASVGIFGLSRMSDFKTPGIRNIENRHAAAGGAKSHTPSQATPMGKEDLVGARPDGANKGLGTSEKAKSTGDQKLEPMAMGKKWHETMHDGDRSKQQT